MAFFRIGLRRAAAQLPRAPFLRNACAPLKLSAPPPRVLQLAAAHRASRSYASAAPGVSKISTQFFSSATADAAKSAPQSGSSQASANSETNAKVVGYWLVGSALSVFGIVVFGGLTRLTESGYVLFGKRLFHSQEC